MARITQTFATSGLHCPSCSMLVDMTVGELDGVVSVKTDHATGVTVVEYDDAALDGEAIIASIRSAGYEASLA